MHDVHRTFTRHAKSSGRFRKQVVLLIQRVEVYFDCRTATSADNNGRLCSALRCQYERQQD